MMKEHMKPNQILLKPGSKPARRPHVEFMPISDLNLANHFLIAMPSMQDPMFGGSVVYLCEHNENGALGVIINKPTEMNIETLLERIDINVITTPDLCQDTKKLVMFGGPVQDDRGFVLHAPVADYTSTLKINDDIAFTTSRDVLEAVAEGRGPKNILVSVGYAGWGAGQLEEEIIKNGWLTVPADPVIMFDLPIEQRLVAAMKLLGFDPTMLSGEAGHA
jgi:putative transcriptional regulator